MSSWMVPVSKSEASVSRPTYKSCVDNEPTSPIGTNNAPSLCPYDEAPLYTSEYVACAVVGGAFAANPGACPACILSRPVAGMISKITRYPALPSKKFAFGDTLLRVPTRKNVIGCGVSSEEIINQSSVPSNSNAALPPSVTSEPLSTIFG